MVIRKLNSPRIAAGRVIARDPCRTYHFAQLLRRDFLRDLQPEGGRFRNFLLVSLRHRLIDEHRKVSNVKRRAEVSLEPWHETEPPRSYGLALSPDGRRLAYGDGDILRVLDAGSLTVLHEETSRSPQFGWLDNDRLLYGFNGSVTAPPYPAPGAWILDFQGVKQAAGAIPRTSFPGMCAPLTVAPDRRTFVLHRVEAVPDSWARTLHVYRTDGDFSKVPQPVYSLPGREFPGHLTLSASGKFLAFSAGVEDSRIVRVLEVASERMLFESAFRFPVNGLAIDPGERRLGVVGDDSTVRVDDFSRGCSTLSASGVWVPGDPLIQ